MCKRRPSVSLVLNLLPVLTWGSYVVLMKAMKTRSCFYTFLRRLVLQNEACVLQAYKQV